MFLILGCGDPDFAKEYVTFKDTIGAEANRERAQLDEAGVSPEHFMSSVNDLQEKVNRKIEDERKYLYDRGPCNAIHGKHCGEDAEASLDGTNGSTGNNGGTGNTGSTGLPGSGTTGPAGPTGPQGPIGPSGTALALGPARVDLKKAGNFAILSKAGITNVSPSFISGNIGTSPIAGSSITALDCIQVSGLILSVDASGPACKLTDATYLTAAVADMQAAYVDAAGRTSPTATELGAGQLGGLTVTPGLYKWSTNVLISTEVVLSGGANDVWIFQIAGNITQANGIRVKLSGGAQAKNIFWQVAGQVTIGTTATFEGTILSQTLVALNTGAVLNGRALAQTEVTLQQSAVTAP